MPHVDTPGLQLPHEVLAGDIRFGLSTVLVVKLRRKGPDSLHLNLPVVGNVYDKIRSYKLALNVVVDGRRAPRILDLPLIIGRFDTNQPGGKASVERQLRSPGVIRMAVGYRSEEHTSELQSREKLVCRLLLEKKKLIR